MQSVRFWSPWLVVCVAMGCGGGEYVEVGTVTGTITLDGTPLANAQVEFTPTKGRPSMATTDSNGKYELIYTLGRKGAKVGAHVVTVRTETAGTPATEGDASSKAVPGTPEKLPIKYHDETELKADVKSGSNTINFDLKSEPGMPRTRNVKSKGGA